VLLLFSLVGCSSKSYFVETSSTKYDLTTATIYIPITKNSADKVLVVLVTNEILAEWC
jgi:hypothetical protein